MINVFYILNGACNWHKKIMKTSIFLEKVLDSKLTVTQNPTLMDIFV